MHVCPPPLRRKKAEYTGHRLKGHAAWLQQIKNDSVQTECCCQSLWGQTQTKHFSIHELKLIPFTLPSCPTSKGSMINWPSVSLGRELHCSWTINPRGKVRGDDVLAHPPEMSHPDAF